jgi:hypothetical protein
VFVTTLGDEACVLKQFDFADDKEKRRIFKEAGALRKLNHPHVVKLLSVVFKSDIGNPEAYIHMPYYSGGDLATWLPKHAPTPEQKQMVLHQVCRGIECIHANGILHCDIKLENIFMDADSVNARPLLADFDISKDAEQRATQTQTATSIQGTMRYMAPEIYSVEIGGKGEPQTIRSDMYAFGVVCLFMFSSQCRENIGAEKDQDLLQLLDDDSPAEVVVLLLKKLLAPEPQDRPTAVDAVNDPALRVDAIVQQLRAEREAADQAAALQTQERKTEREIMAVEAAARYDEAAVQHAKELRMARLPQPLKKTAFAAHKCSNWRKAKAVVDEWGLDPHVFHPDADMCYCGECAEEGGHDPALKDATRGQPAKTYAFPIGWCRLGMKLPAGMSADMMDAGHVAFHGTRKETAVAILQSKNPQLLKPGTITESGFKIPIRSGHIEEPQNRLNKHSGEMEMFDPNQIFMSPTIKYCEHASYTRFEDSPTGARFKTAFQIRIADGQYDIGQETVGVTGRIDPLFSNNAVEWYTLRIGAPVLHGLLIELDPVPHDADGGAETDLYETSSDDTDADASGGGRA